MKKIRQNYTHTAAAMKRMPNYFRTLRKMLVEGKLRVTSGELAEQTGFTITQIRVDLRSFPDVGQRGYGYNVRELYTSIASSLGTGFGYKAVCVGEESKQEWLESLCGRCGVRLIDAIGADAEDAVIIEAVRNIGADIGIILPNCKEPERIMNAMKEGGVKGVLNYADLTLFHPDIAVRNCSLSDPLLSITGDMRIRENNGEDLA